VIAALICYPNDEPPGDEATIRTLQERVKDADIETYWQTHERDLNVMYALKLAASSASIPKDGSFHNIYQGREDAWQSHETIDNFVSRLPVSSSEWVGPWLWVANPYADRKAEPEVRNHEFAEQGPQLLENYLQHKQQITDGNPGMVQGTITRKLKPARDELKDDILSLARSTGMVCGKWMLFPHETDATGVWKRVALATIENKLGVGAKIATSGDTRLICIYTRDFSDEEDVRRVVQEIEKMGLLLANTDRSIYYKCDAYTHLGIGSQNEYGLQASLYASKDVLAGKPVPKDAAQNAPKGQKRAAAPAALSKAAGKRKKS
jgi:hypothetical protein